MDHHRQLFFKKISICLTKTHSSVYLLFSWKVDSSPCLHLRCVQQLLFFLIASGPWPLPSKKNAHTRTTPPLKKRMHIHPPLPNQKKNPKKTPQKDNSQKGGGLWGGKSWLCESNDSFTHLKVHFVQPIFFPSKLRPVFNSLKSFVDKHCLKYQPYWLNNMIQCENSHIVWSWHWLIVGISSDISEFYFHQILADMVQILFMYFSC